MNTEYTIYNVSVAFLSGSIPAKFESGINSGRTHEVNLTKGPLKVSITFDISKENFPAKYTITQNLRIGLRPNDEYSPVIADGKVEATFTGQDDYHVSTILTINEGNISLDKSYYLFITVGNLMSPPVFKSCPIRFYKLPIEVLPLIFRIDNVEFLYSYEMDADVQNLYPDLIWMKYNIKVDKNVSSVYPTFYVTYYCEDGCSWSTSCVQEVSDCEDGMQRILMLYCQFTTEQKLTEHGAIYAELSCFDHGISIIRCDDACIKGNIIGADQLLDELPMSIKKKIKEMKKVKVRTSTVKPSGMDQLNSLIGLSDIKERISTYLNLMRMDTTRKDHGYSSLDMPLHTMFLGNPGTGKTTVAKIFGQLLKEIGILSKGHVVVRERSTLIGEYYGTPSKLVNEALREAEGGILFIDEAYQLHTPYDSRDPGKDVIGALLTTLADTSNRDWMLILAGYTNPMLRMFEMNPGLSSRIPDANRFVFPDYTEDELMTIAKSYLQKKDFVLSKDAERLLTNVIHIDYENKDKNFGNARYVMNLIETKIFPKMANRLSAISHPSEEELQVIEAVDIPKALPKITTDRKIGYAI